MWVVRVEAREHARDDRARRRTGGVGIVWKVRGRGRTVCALAERVVALGWVVARSALFRTGVYTYIHLFGT